VLPSVVYTYYKADKLIKRRQTQRIKEAATRRTVRIIKQKGKRKAGKNPKAVRLVVV
jgi:hypothetical protein